MKMNDQVEFKIGDKVRVKQDSLESYKVDFQNKVSGGRIGIVRGFPIGRNGTCKDPIVFFPALGRKKDYNPGQITIKDLELVEVAEIGKSMEKSQ